MPRAIEIFSAGCPLCTDTIELVNTLVSGEQEVRVLDMRRGETVTRARELGVRSLPAVVVDGTLAGCCAGRGPDEQALRDALR